MDTPCVDIEILSHIISGKMGKEAKKRIVAHTKTCPECFVRVNSALLTCCDPSLDQYMPLSEKEVTSLVKKIDKKIKKPIGHSRKAIQKLTSWGDGLAPDLPLIYGYARTQADPMSQIKIDYIHIEKSFDEIKTVILFEKYFDRFTIHIRVSHPHSGLYNIRFNLMGEEGQVSRLLKEGHASFEDFPFGEYELVVIHKQHEKGRYHFQVNNKGLLNGENTLS